MPMSTDPADQHAEDGDDVGDHLGGLERGLRLGRQATDGVAIGVAVAADVVAGTAGSANCAHKELQWIAGDETGPSPVHQLRSESCPETRENERGLGASCRLHHPARRRGQTCVRMLTHQGLEHLFVLSRVPARGRGEARVDGHHRDHAVSRRPARRPWAVSNGRSGRRRDRDRPGDRRALPLRALPAAAVLRRQPQVDSILRAERRGGSPARSRCAPYAAAALTAERSEDIPASQDAIS